MVEGRFESVSKEDSWKKFQEKMEGDFTIDGLKSADSKYLALITFEKILKRKWTKNIQEPSLNRNLTEKDKDIVAYVAGSIITKLSHKYQADSDHLAILSTLKCHKDDENVAHASMTMMKDRGGLCYITEESFSFFSEIELIFLKECQLKNDFSESDFFSSALITKELFVTVIKTHPQFLFQWVTDDIYSVYHDIVRLYFKIRIHHRCAVESQKQVPAKKGLRKSLKMKAK